jgi:hypothetical protein
MANHDRCERAFEIGRRISLGTAGGDGVTKHLAGALFRTVRGLVFASRLKLPKRDEELRWRDVANRPRADV